MSNRRKYRSFLIYTFKLDLKKNLILMYIVRCTIRKNIQYAVK